MDKTLTAESWAAATALVEVLAIGLPIYWGTGNPISWPHVVAYSKDAWSGEGLGYNVSIYRQGSGYMVPVECYSINLL